MAACTLLTDLSGFSDGAGATDGSLADARDDTSTTDARAGDADGADGADGRSNETSMDGGSAYAAAVLSDNPLVYLRLGEPSGAVANDSTNRGNSGTLGTGHTFGVKGAIAGDPDTALHLDGVKSGIALGRKFDFPGTQPYSLEIWAKIELGDGQFRHLFKKSAEPVAGREAYGIFVYNATLVFERIIAGTKRVVDRSPSILNRWVHFVSTYDGALLRLYVDGVEIGSTADARPAGPIDAIVWVGANDGFDFVPIQGDLDEVAIYDKALPAARVKAHFDIGSGL
jgi:hypothetical protein